MDRNQKSDGAAEKIFILHSGGIGDLLLALPAMRIFRQALPTSILHLLGRPERLALVSHDLGACAIHSIDQAGMAYFFLEGGSLPPSLLTLFSSSRAALVFGKAGENILAENLKRAGIERVFSISSFPPADSKIHASDYLIEALKNEGFSGKNGFAPLRLSPEAMTFGESFWNRLGLKKGERVLAMHSGSGSPAKNWGPKNFAEVADWASERGRVLLISGPADDETEVVKAAMKKAKPITASHLPLPQLAGVLKSCTAYLGNDSGITHLAAGVGIPTVALFGPTSPAIWSPWGPEIKTICRRDSGIPHPDPKRNGTSCSGFERIEAKEVIELLECLL